MMIPLMVWAFTLSTVSGNVKSTSVMAACRDDDIILPCDALQYNQSYTSVTWYKVYNNTYSSILINEKNIFTKTDKIKDSVSLGDNVSLIIWKAAPENAGNYECFLRGKVGSKNKVSHITLNISECMSTASPVFDFSTLFINSTNSLMNSSIPLSQVDKNAEMSAILVYLGLALSKIFLCAFCIRVFEGLKKHRRRH